MTSAMWNRRGTNDVPDGQGRAGHHRRCPEQDFGTMSRGFPADAHPVIHEHELYSAELAGDILLDLPRAGTFEQEGGGSRRALRADAAAEAVSAGARDTRFREVLSVQLP